MNAKQLARYRAVLGWTIGAWSVAAAGVVAGCSGSDADVLVRKPASERPDIDRPAAAGTITIPTAQAFNITSFKSGQEGQARGETKPVENDGVQCRAEARDDGSAWAEFQLGYCFDNTAAASLSASVRLRLQVAESNSGQPPATTQPAEPNIAATNRLSFFIKDTNGLVVKQETLAAGDFEKGPHSSSAKLDRVFDAKFESGRGYYLVITGRTEVKAGAGLAAAAALDISQCSLEIAWTE